MYDRITTSEQLPWLPERMRVLRAFALCDVFRLLSEDLPADTIYLYCRNTNAFPCYIFRELMFESQCEFCSGNEGKDSLMDVPASLKKMAREYMVNMWADKVCKIFEFASYESVGNRKCQRRDRRGMKAYPPAWKNAFNSLTVVQSDTPIDAMRHGMTSLHSVIVQSAIIDEIETYCSDRRLWQPLDLNQSRKFQSMLWSVESFVRGCRTRNQLPSPVQMELLCKVIELCLFIRASEVTTLENIVYLYRMYLRMKRESTTWLIDKCNGGRGPGVSNWGDKCREFDGYGAGEIDGAMYHLSHLSPTAAICIGNIFRTNWSNERVYGDEVLNFLSSKVNPKPETCIGIYFMQESELQLRKLEFARERERRKQARCSEEPCCDDACPSAC